MSLIQKSILISEFLKLGFNDFNSTVTSSFQESHSELKSTQSRAWRKEYEDLQKVLIGMDGRIIFEYSIPNLPKVIDVVLLTEGKVFVIEYKAGAISFNEQDVRQVEGYALRLKYFHNLSNDRLIVPILVATDSGSSADAVNVATAPDEDNVYDTIKCNSENLRSAIDIINQRHPNTSGNEWEERWEYGIYKASPTIIKAAEKVWESNNVNGFKIGEASEDTRLAAEDYIVDSIVEEAKNRGGKSICFVTGVPGAGKTLVGLNASVRLQKYGACMLSGNGPLVEVLTAALKRDLTKHKKNLSRPKDEISVDSIIRGAYGYKKEIFDKRLDYIPGTGKVQLKGNAEKSEQRIIIFDEAQRAWNHEKMIRPGQTGRKYWQEEMFPFSEAGLLLWDMNQRDWGVFVCLVGGGQEINTGESGICEWLHALKYDSSLADWKIYISDQLRSKEYENKSDNDETLDSYIKTFSEQGRITINSSLHLTACQRSNRTEKVSAFVQSLLDCDQTKASELYADFRDKYRIYLTHDIELAKQKLRERRNDLSPRAYLDGIDDEEIRIGMLMSSQAARLRPLGYSIIKVSEYLSKTPNWFLDSDEYVNSSNYLELALNEFFVQGLELDLTAVMWDADFRYNPKTNSWDYYVFNGKNWSAVPDDKSRELKRFYMMNAYRVLLTRARAGMIIVVPEGSMNDPNGNLIDQTRNPMFYQDTYNYLENIGLDKLEK